MLLSQYDIITLAVSRLTRLTDIVPDTDVSVPAQTSINTSLKCERLVYVIYKFISNRNSNALRVLLRKCSKSMQTSMPCEQRCSVSLSRNCHGGQFQQQLKKRHRNGRKRNGGVNDRWRCLLGERHDDCSGSDCEEETAEGGRGAAVRSLSRVTLLRSATLCAQLQHKKTPE